MSGTPVVSTLVTRMKAELVDGAVAGTRLPAMRVLARRYGASPVTVHAAIQVLAKMGLVDPRPGDGTYILETPETFAALDHGWQSATLGPASRTEAALGEVLRLPGADAANLAGGYLDSSLHPDSMLRHAIALCSRRPEAWGRAHSAGLEPLRAWFATAIGAGTQPHEVLVTSGGQAALAAAFRALVPARSPVLLESPTWLGAIAAATASGHTLVPVPTDHEGIRPEALRAAFRRTGARLLYIQPLHANPTGHTLSAARRAAVLDAAREAEAFILEDDYARDLSGLPRPPAPLLAGDNDHVVYVRSLTKSLLPSLRVAALVARGPAATRLREARRVEELFVSRFLQEVALELVRTNAYQNHLYRVRTALAQRRAALVQALRAIGLQTTDPNGAYSVWVRLPEMLDEDRVVAECGYAGVIVNGGRPWFPADAPGPHLRLSVAAATPADIADGVARLAAVIARSRAGM